MNSWKRRGSGLLVLVGLVWLLVAGLGRLSLDVAFLKLLPQELREVQGLGLMLEHFALPQEAVLTLETGDSERSEELAAELARWLEGRPELIRRVVHRAPWEGADAEMAELVALALLNAGDAAFERVLGNLKAEGLEARLGAVLEEVEGAFSLADATRLGYDPFGLLEVLLEGQEESLRESSAFASPDGLLRLLYLEAGPELSSYKVAGRWLGDLLECLEEWRAALPDGLEVKVGLTGEPIFLAEISAGMERDMMGSGVATFFLVGLIFWGFYRRLVPLLLLLGTIALAFVLSLALAGLVLGSLTVLSVGFASILIGLSVDYGLILYQRRLLMEETVGGSRRAAAPAILWAAATTAAAFLALNAGRFPGLGQLGTLVALGIGAAALLMLGPYLSGLHRWAAVEPGGGRVLEAGPGGGRSAGVLWLVAGFSLVAMWPLVSGGFPALDGSTSALHPRQSLAYETSARLQEVMMAAEGRRSLLIAGDASGAAEGGLSRRLAEAERWLEGERAAGRVEAFWLPGIFWPEAELQWRRLSRLRGEMAAPETLRGALLEAGFTEASFALTAAVLAEWQRLEVGALPFFPQRDSVRWLLRRLISHDADQAVAQGWVQWVGEPAAGADYPEGVWPASWPDLGVALSGMSAVDFKRIALVFLLVLTLMLSCALRSARRVLLCLLVVGLSYLILSGLMRWLGMDWNFFSLASLLLILGTGVDYSLHVLFGLSEAGGRRAEMMRRVGKPIALCGLSTMAGFGSLGFASNVGLASLGVVCALGIGVNLLLTLVLLPHLDGWSVRSARSG